MEILNISMNNKNSMTIRIRAVQVNSRGQVVIPQEMRKTMKIKEGDTLMLIEKENELIVRKEEDVAKKLGEEEFWEKAKLESLKKAWSREDDAWDKIWEKELK